MYNAATYIGNCLNSIINQGLLKEEFEVIIMDDGSTDNCADIVCNYLINNENFTLYRETNSGSDSTRNKLLKYAKGDYIYFLDADDYLAYNSLKSILDYAVKNELDFIGFDTLKTKKLDHFDVKFDKDKPSASPIINGLQFLKENRHLRHEVWWYLLKRDLILSNEIRFDSNGNNSDVVFTVKSILKAERLLYYPITIHRYLQTPSSVMRDKSVSNKRKLIDSMFNMIISYSKLINSIEHETLEHKSAIIDNLKFRRDVFVFFNIMNIIREKYSKIDVVERLKQLSKVKAYPIKHFTQDHYKSLKYIVLNGVVNNKTLLTVIPHLHPIFLSIFRKQPIGRYNRQTQNQKDYPN